MDVVLGVSMTPVAVRMVLVEGEDADGVTVDHQCFDLTAATAAEQVIAGILGTRDSAAEGGHRIHTTGVAWTDHSAAAQLTKALRAQKIDDVVLVSELHAASALAQAIGQALGCERTALIFLERDTATLAVVRSDDGAVVRVAGRSLHAPDAVAELQNMVAGLERLAQPPQAVFMVGAGIDVGALKPKIAAGTSLTVHAPEDGALALARGAALAVANAPRFEASTVGLASTDDTATEVGIITQRAFAGYMAPMGYSAVPDDDDDLPADPDDETCQSEPEREPFVLVGSALMTIFVVGVLALVASLVVTIRPTADQRPGPAADAGISSSQLNSSAPETIANPVPVVQEAPRTVFVTPRAAVPAAPAAPTPPVATFAPQVPAPMPEATAPLPQAPAPAVEPAPVAPAPVIPQLLPQIVAPPIINTPVPRSPAATPTTTSAAPAQTSSSTQTSSSKQAPVPSSTPSSTTAEASTSAESTSATTGSAISSPTGSSAVSTTPLLPTTPAA